MSKCASVNSINNVLSAEQLTGKHTQLFDFTINKNICLPLRRRLPKEHKKQIYRIENESVAATLIFPLSISLGNKYNSK